MNIKQVLSVSLQSLKNNKLRTMLTVLGIVVGIFSVIVIMTIITMLQSSIENGVSQLAKNTFQIQKFPVMVGGGPGSHARFRNRKDLTLNDFDRFYEMMGNNALHIGAEQWQFGKLVRYGNKETNPNISVAGVTTGAMLTNNWVIAYGRELRENDVKFSNDVCILGQDVVEKIFPSMNPIGEVVRVDNKPYKVIGVLEKEPALFGESRDNRVIIPISTFQAKYGKNSYSVNITVMSRSKEDYNATIESAIGYMRTIRKLAPAEENDFDIFSNESIMGQINDITGGVKIGAIVVSIIALIAAGVGIMNIMLVSVTERTREIGIRKAVGAKKLNILMQFLLEAVTLCLIGGVIGIILGVGLGNLVGGLINAQSAIPYNWVLMGILLCVSVGVIFGTYPAYKAANLDPIEALRYE
jgi:putative ABC transport system permease protein